MVPERQAADMKRNVFIAHAPSEEDRAEELARPIRDAGYDVTHHGTMLVGSSPIAEVSTTLTNGGPVVVCGTVRAIGMGWARKVVSAARASEVRVFVVQMEEYADVESLAFGEKFARYWQSRDRAIDQLVTALRTHYPISSDEQPAAKRGGRPAGRSVGSGSTSERDGELLADYLDALCAEISLLRPGRLRKFNLPLELGLDEIYVELEAAPERPDVDRRVTLEELAEARRQVENWDWKRERDREQQLRLYAELDRSFRHGHSPAGTPENLADIVESHQQVVILGDPGCGKTTLLKYLALQAARTIRTASEPAVDGPERVPLYIRISEFAELRAATGSDLALSDYIARYVAGLQVRSPDDVASMLRRFLEEGRCITLLDGLDEVIADGDRVKVAAAIAQFAEVFRDTGGADARRNIFAVTSRVAGYRPFINMPVSFSEYTIKPMSRAHIDHFLDRWCEAVERRLQPEARPSEVKQQAQSEKALILNAISGHPGVRRLADNPLLLRILAMLHRSEGRLPQRRAELYKEATKMLLHDWHLERLGPAGAAIDENVALKLLGPVAMHIHTHQPSGLLSLGETEMLLCRIRGPQLGDPPDQPSVETMESVRKFLKTVREHSGLFVERGTGLFGFMHLTFQEYFVARHLVRHRETARAEIKSRLHQPRWREPILLAIASATDPFTHDIEEYLESILHAGSEHEEVLHRDLLFAAECMGDCVGVSPMLRREVARRLIAIYCDVSEVGRYALLRRQIRDALLVINDPVDYWAVEAALADVLGRCASDVALLRSLEIVDLLEARTQPLIDALERVPAQKHVLHDIRRTLRHVQNRAVAETPGSASLERANVTGWRAYGEDPFIARVLGALWLFGWRDVIEVGFGVPDEALRRTSAGNDDGSLIVLARLRQLGWQLESSLDGLWDNLTAMTLEVDAIGRDLHGAGGSDSNWLKVANVLASARSWHQGASSSMSNRVLAYVVDSLTLDAAKAFKSAEGTSSELAAELLSNLYALRRGHRFTVGQTMRFRAKARLLADQAETGSIPAQIFTLMASPPRGLRHLNPDCADPASAAAETYRRQLDSVSAQLEELLGADTYTERLEDWGRAILRHAPFADAVAPAVAEAIRQAVPLTPVPDRDGWQSTAEAAGAALMVAANALLRRTKNARQYTDAAHLLARVGEQAVCGQALGCVAADLIAEQPERRLLAVGALRDPGVRRYIDADWRTRLTELARLQANMAGPALDLLFTFKLTPQLLSWCWAVLREDDSALAGIVRRHVDAVEEVEGTTTLLEVLDDGLRHDATRSIARELLTKASWVGTETYAQCLAWLSSTDEYARSVSARLLSVDDRLHAVPLMVFGEAARVELEERVSSSHVSWRALADRPEVVRLLHALWMLGWQNALTTLWMGEPSNAYLAAHAPEGGFRDSKSTVRWLMQEAHLGQALIPTIICAAERLAELEQQRVAPSAWAPQPNDDVAVVQQQLVRELDDLSRESQLAAPLSVRADAGILAAALRQQPLPVPPALTLQRVLAESSGFEWYWAAARLASTPGQPAWLRPILAESLVSSDPLRRDLALLLLSGHQRLRQSMQGAITQILNDLDFDDSQAVLCASLLLATGSAGAEAVNAWLRAVRSGGDADDNPQHDRSPAATARRMLPTNRPLDRAAAAARLLGSDLYMTLVPALVDAAQARHDRLRWESAQRLGLLCQALPTDGSTAAVGWLHGQLSELANGRSGEGKGHIGTVLRWAVGQIHHRSPHWVTAWTTVLDRDDGDESERSSAAAAVGLISNGSDEVLGWLCGQLTSARRAATRRAAAAAFVEIRRSCRSEAEPVTTVALLTALGDPAEAVRRAAAYALQWSLFEVETVSEALLLRANTDPDAEVRAVALISLGRCRRGSQPATDISADPFLGPVLELLSEPDPRVSRAAAAAVAAAVGHNSDAIALLSSCLPNQYAVLTAMLNAAADTHGWMDAEGSHASHHPRVVSRLAEWIHEQPEPMRNRLVDLLLSGLEQASAGMEEPDDDDDAPCDPPWAVRRIITAVLAELSEQLTHHSFSTRPLAEVVSLFARTARDPDSFNTRRFSLRILGNLQHFTPDVATAFFEACRDVSDVYQEPKSIIAKFKRFTSGSFEKLTSAMFDQDSDASSSYHAATLLGELGVNRSDELGSSRRRLIGTELVRMLNSSLTNRTVSELYTSGESEYIRVAAPLYAGVYEALVRVVTGPDFPEAGRTPDTGPEATVWQTSHEGVPPEWPESLRRFELDALPTDEEIVRPHVSVIWVPATGGDHYRVSINGSSQWARDIWHKVEDGYLQLVIQPVPGNLPIEAQSIVIGPGEDVTAESTAEPEPNVESLLGEPGTRLLHRARLGIDDLVIGIPGDLVAEPTYVQRDRSLHLNLEPRSSTRLKPEHVVVAGADLNVSFPHWPGGIEKITYTIEDNRLNILLVPEEDGLKLRGIDVVFSRGGSFPVFSKDDIRRIRRRKGRKNLRLTVSLPHVEGTVKNLSYRLDDTALHIIVAASTPFSYLTSDDAQFIVTEATGPSVAKGG